MPHKHTRKQTNDESEHNLAPSAVAKPLPAFSSHAKHGRGPATKDHQKASGKKRQSATTKARPNVKGYGTDDTPRAFARLLDWQKGGKRASGPDNGDEGRKGKKRRVADDAAVAATKQEELIVNEQQLKILPGESLAAFSTRVNQALPLGNLSHKGKKVEGVKERQTRTEKRLHRMYAEWRVEDAKIKERLEEEQEKAEEEAEERAAQFGGQDISLPPSKRAKRRRLLGEVSDGEDGDPWAVLKRKRNTQPSDDAGLNPGRLKGVNDVVQAPPSINVIPKERFKVRNGASVNVANVPNAAGSLKRREELGAARQEVIERYRAIMKPEKT